MKRGRKKGGTNPGSTVWILSRLKVGQSWYSDRPGLDRNLVSMKRGNSRESAAIRDMGFSIRRLVAVHNETLEAFRIVQVTRTT